MGVIVGIALNLTESSTFEDITMALNDTNLIDITMERFINPLRNTPYFSNNNDDNLQLWTLNPNVVIRTLKIVHDSISRCEPKDPYGGGL